MHDPGYQTTNMSTQQLDRLLGFLAADPGNARLLQDCASAAMDAHQYDTAAALVARAEAEGPLASELLNLKGVMAMMHQDHAAAQLAFQALLDAGVNDTGICFNLAWSKAMLGEYTDAEALLDDAVVTAVPRAAGLKIQMLHHLQRMDDAFAHGARYAKQYPHDQALFGALAILALDADKADLAAYYAQQAQATPEGLSTLGSLLLGEGQAADSQSYFAEAIRLNPSSGRSWLGQGLAGISQGASSRLRTWTMPRVCSRRI
jgi:tetratricopeptide (TPR) repeat protein